MKFYDAVNYCLGKECNQTYIVQLNCYMFSGKIPGTDVLGLYMTTDTGWPVNMVINGQVVHYEYIKQ